MLSRENALFPPAIVVEEKTGFFLTAPFSHNTPRSHFIAERQAMRDISRLIRSRAGGKDEEWPSTQMQKQHTDSSAYVRLDYAMICRLSSNDVSRRDV
jgi:hypothetical protein